MWWSDRKWERYLSWICDSSLSDDFLDFWWDTIPRTDITYNANVASIEQSNFSSITINDRDTATVLGEKTLSFPSVKDGELRKIIYFSDNRSPLGDFIKMVYSDECEVLADQWTYSFHTKFPVIDVPPNMKYRIGCKGDTVLLFLETQEDKMEYLLRQ